MCAEQEPLDCHRTVLVSRVLAERGASVAHIHGDGRLETHEDAMLRLMSGFGLDQDDLFHTHEEWLSEALARQEQRIAYVDKDWSLGEVQQRMKLYTIGFTKKSASTFFGLLAEIGSKAAGRCPPEQRVTAGRLCETRRPAYFLAEICGMGYRHELQLAPTKPMLDDYKKHGARWDDYERWFLDLIAEGQIEDRISPALLDNSVLLCSETTAHHRHRRRSPIPLPALGRRRR